LALMSRLARAIASNYVVLAIQAGSLLLLAPLIISHQGIATFGRWSLIVAITGYLRLLDLGVGPATARSVAVASGSTELSAAVSTTACLLAGVGLVAVVSAVGVGVTAPSVGPGHEFQLALAVAITSLAIQLPLTVADQVLYGLDRIVERNLFGGLRASASFLTMAVFVILGQRLVVFVLAGASAELVIAVAQAAFVWITVPGLRMSVSSVGGRQLRQVGRISIGIFGLSVASQLVVYSDTIVVGAFLGASTTGVYSIAMRIIGSATQFLNQASDVFLPRFSSAHATGSEVGAGRGVAVATRLTVCIAFALIGVFVAFGDRLIHVWVGAGFDRAWVPLLLLSGSLALNAPLRFAVLWAIAGNQHQRIARFALAEAAVNVALTLAVVGPLGIRGVAAVSMVTFTISNGWLIPRFVFPRLGLNWLTDFVRPIGLALVASVPVSAGVHAALGSARPAAWIILIGSAVWFGLVLTALWLLVLGRSERRAVVDALRVRAAVAR
jgi:O-antigen/teichoic acid export membrane protein